MTNESVELRVKELISKLNPRTVYQYKLYQSKYIKWYKNYIVKDNTTNDNKKSNYYADIKVNAPLIHLYILHLYETSKTEEEEEGEGEINAEKNKNTTDLIDHNSDDNINIATYRKIISSLNLLNKIIVIHKNEKEQFEEQKEEREENANATVGEEYLENVIKLYNFKKNINTNIINKKQLYPTPLEMSINFYNDQTIELNNKFPKYFRTSLEKLRFLVDFHIQHFTNLAFKERNLLLLKDLHVMEGEDTTLFVTHDFGEYKISSFLPSSPLHQVFDNPLISLACYSHLRFYGGPNYKGDGYPTLKNIEVDNYPLIRGRSFTKPPIEDTMGLYYSCAFQYLHKPYKKNNYFAKKHTGFFKNLQWALEDWDYINESNKYIKSKFHCPYMVTDDFLHVYDYLEDTTDKTVALYLRDSFNSQLPENLLTQIFPESDDNSSHSALEFNKVMKLLRRYLLFGLPIIYRIFPQHDIFQSKDGLFSKQEFVKFYKTILEKYDRENPGIWSNYNLGDLVENYTPINIPTPAISTLGPIPIQDTNTNPSIGNNTYTTMDHNYALATGAKKNESMLPVHRIDSNTIVEFTKYQILSNFKTLIGMLQTCFNRFQNTTGVTNNGNIALIEGSRSSANNKIVSPKKFNRHCPFIEASQFSSVLQIIENQLDAVNIKDLHVADTSSFKGIRSKKKLNQENIVNSGDSEADFLKQEHEVEKSNHIVKNKGAGSDGDESEEDDDDDDDDEDTEAQELQRMIVEIIKRELRANMTLETRKLTQMFNKYKEDLIAEIIDEFQMRYKEEIKEEIRKELKNDLKNEIANEIKESLKNEVLNSEIKAITREKSLSPRKRGLLDYESSDIVTIQTKNTDQNNLRYEGLGTSPRKKHTLARTRSTTNMENNKKIRLDNDADKDKTIVFKMNPDKNLGVEDIILEWYSPNEKYGNECVHSTNKRLGKHWRLQGVNAEMYKIRKPVVECYINFVNNLGVDRFEALNIMKEFCSNKFSDDIPSFSEFLKNHKKNTGMNWKKE
ncbi:Cbf2p SCDLUD_002366 [Saccharomycodes ludwigii]|uniref:Cbf2p n=1 Tax=Saccharomycodes ludwigii TaxID=36035 RepID=UPI001E85F4B5|nr:hypothetical protein SCDLUD_002366 [Saccharomycodes ludwigii]KAH3900906.1 hypothetical protein SCDLUD_002366 [Saccharomycodes ludwigii]